MIEQTVVRSGDIRKISGRFENGGVTEIWVRGGLAAQRSPDYPHIIIRLRDGLYAEDFPELDWIGSENFAGEVKRDGRTFWKFTTESFPLRFRDRGLYESVRNESGNSDTLDLGKPVKVEALVDAETKLPFELRIDREVRSYAFPPPPTEPISLPSDVLAAIGDLERRFEAISKPLSRP